MNDLVNWLHAQGIGLPGSGFRLQAAIAAAIVAAAVVLGWLAGRTLGKMLCKLWQAHIASHAEGLGDRMPRIVRHGASALLLAIALNTHHWPPLAGIILGLPLGLAAALAAVQILRGLHLPRWTAWLLAIVLFVGLFSHAVGGLSAITHVLDRVGFEIGKRRFSLLSLTYMLVTVVALLAIVRLANRVIGHWITQTKGFDPTQQLLAQKLASIVIIVAAFFIGIDLLDIDLTAFAVFSGAFGLAIGFGFQKTFGNLIAGIILLMDRSIKPGDVIVVADKEVGWVKKIGVRAVSVITRDGKEHLIPNENLMTQEVENWSYSDRNVRVRIKVGVAYDCDLKLAQDLMLRAAVESPRVLKSPKPNIWLTEFGDNSVNHEILAWIGDPEGGVGNVRSDVLNRLWWLFKEHEIEIPFPQRDVRVQMVSAPPPAAPPPPGPAPEPPPGDDAPPEPADKAG